MACAAVGVEAGVAPRTGLDEDAIRAFVVEDYPRIVTGLSVMCGSRSAAEDAVQDALAKAWERSERGEHIEQLAGWVTVVARNNLRSWFRRLRAERRARQTLEAREALERVTGAGAAAGAPDDRLDVARALALLTETQREITVLHYYLGMTVADVGRALGISDGTVKSTLYRARQILAPALGLDEPSGGVTHDARP
jgi:RNA polymerase sigma-70 factor, ECF subfamily